MRPHDTIIVDGRVVPIWRSMAVEANGMRVSDAQIEMTLEGVRASLEISEWDIELSQIAAPPWSPYSKLRVLVHYPTEGIPPEDPYYRQVNPFSLRDILRQMRDIIKHGFLRAAYPERYPTPFNRTMWLDLIVSQIERSFVTPHYTISAVGYSTVLRNNYMQEII